MSNARLYVEEFTPEIFPEAIGRSGIYVWPPHLSGESYGCGFFGFALHPDDHDGPVIEEDVFDVAYIAAQHPQSSPGLGSQIAEVMLDAAKESGFGLARMRIENPKIVSILERFKANSIIDAVTYALSGLNGREIACPRPSHDFTKGRAKLSPEEAKAHINSHQLDDLAKIVSHGSVAIECLVEI